MTGPSPNGDDTATFLARMAVPRPTLPGDSFFAIAGGNALGPGDFFGEIAILDGGRRTATAHPAIAAQLSRRAVSRLVAPPQ